MKPFYSIQIFFGIIMILSLIIEVQGNILDIPDKDSMPISFMLIIGIFVSVSVYNLATEIDNWYGIKDEVNKK